jgi:hypothetical protein
MDSPTRVRDDTELHPSRRGSVMTPASIKELGEDLQQSLKGFLPRTSTPYKKVTCLLITWKHAFKTNEGGVQDDLQEFAQLMREHFHFGVEEYLLDYTKSAKTIDREIMARCLDVQSDKDELVIIYYTGHAYYQEWTRHTMFW